jgi:hypothetical protein
MGTGVGEAMIIGAVTGAGTSAITGGDPLKGALLGAAGGGIGAGVGGALGGQAAGAQSATASQVAGQLGQGAATGAGSQAAMLAEQAAGFGAPGLEAISSAAQMAPGVTQAAMPNLGTIPQTGLKDLFSAQSGNIGSKIGNYLVQNPMQVGMAAGVLGGIKSFEEENPYIPPKYTGPLSRFRYDPDKYRTAMASGGLADTAVAQRYMKGGHLGSYSDGGRLLKGPGDGMSDSIPAKIGSKQPARLADGEFVVPADVVSGLGNGSTDAGARKLYAMMDKVRKSRTGTKRQGKEINSNKYLPA